MNWLFFNLERVCSWGCQWICKYEQLPWCSREFPYEMLANQVKVFNVFELLFFAVVVYWKYSLFGPFFPNYFFARRVSHQRASLGLRNAIATATALTSFQAFLFFLSLGARQKVGMGREQERSWKRSCSWIWLREFSNFFIDIPRLSLRMFIVLVLTSLPVSSFKRVA